MGTAPAPVGELLPLLLSVVADQQPGTPRGQPVGAADSQPLHPELLSQDAHFNKTSREFIPTVRSNSSGGPFACGPLSTTEMISVQQSLNISQFSVRSTHIDTHRHRDRSFACVDVGMYIHRSILSKTKIYLNPGTRDEIASFLCPIY